MKKIRFFAIFLVMIGLFFAPIFGEENQLKLKSWEFIPSISASGTQDYISVNTELRIAGRFFLNQNKSWFIFGQAGFMYNLFENKIEDQKFSEWQLGLQPLVGFGTRHIRLSGFFNSLNLKVLDNIKMPFTEIGARFTLVPWKKFHLRIRGLITWPISNPILIYSNIEDIEYENNEGVFLQRKTTEKWARQEQSFEGNIDIGIGKKTVFNLIGFACDEDYQIGGGLQYKVFKKKPWVINANVFYTDFQKKEYLYVHNVFPGMFDENMRGWTAKIGISNAGGISNIDFTNFQMQIAEPLYFSPVILELVSKISQPQKINDPYKIEGCNIDNGCQDWEGFVCQSGGKTGYDNLIDYGDGTLERRENVGSGSMHLSHHYQHPGIYLIIVSGRDALGITTSYSKQITIKDCNDNPPPPPPPPPPPNCDPVYSNAQQCFKLSNSSEKEETKWAHNNVAPYLIYKGKKEIGGSYYSVKKSVPLILIKAGLFYSYFLNVTPGQKLYPYNCDGKQHDISHVTIFDCK